MALLTREQIDSAADRVLQEVEVPKWGGSVMVRTLTGHERDEYLQAVVDQSGAKATAVIEKMTARLCALCICDKDGDRLYTTAEIDLLGARSAAMLEIVFNAAKKLNAIDQEDIEELAKN